MNPLSGRTILITRAAEQAEDFALLVSRHGGNPIVAPTIEIIPPDSWERCDNALSGLAMYNGLIFTSVNGVRFFFQRMKHLGIEAGRLSAKNICAVGEKTREEIESHGLQTRIMPEKFTADDLARAMGAEDLTGQAFLFPRGNLGSTVLPDTLKRLGAFIEPVPVYQTCKPQPERLIACRDDLLAGKIDVITFTSPSTFENFISFFSPSECGRMLSGSLIASIGPVTTRAIESAGYRIDIQSQQSTIASLVDAIIHHFRGGAQ